MNFKLLAVTALSTLALSVFLNTAFADVKLAPIFTDNMVLQRDKPISVWGTAKPGEKVEVILSIEWGKLPTRLARIAPPDHKKATADADGNWRVTLGAKRFAGNSLMSLPRYINVESKNEGGNSIQLKNIAIGDVYICSGQSNMEWPLAQTKSAQVEIASANFPNIRLLTVPRKIAGTPQKEFAGATSWQVCSSETVPGFSAVGYFFGRELNQKTNIPIGLINASWGGTIAQAWMSKSTLIKRDDLRALTLQTEQNLSVSPAILEKQMRLYWAANDIGAREGWSTPAFDDAAWKTMKVPGVWEANGLADFDGVAWFRQTIEIPANMAGQDLTLHLGAIDDSDTTFFNGEVVGSMTVWHQPRVYKIPAAIVKAGRNIIAVRVLDTGGAGGFGSIQVPQLELANDANQKIVFAPEWKYQVSAALKDLPPIPANDFDNPNQPAVLFNGMIAPLLDFPVRGAIWYQGESNADNPRQYQTLLPELIRDWRTQWNAKQDGEEFGFYFVQLANFMARVDQPVESGWAELREAQTMALSTPRVGMATILDVGEAADIHPQNKRDVGKRLALAALAKEYGQNIEYSGPMFSKMERIANTNRTRISFSHAKGLTVNPHLSIGGIIGKDYPEIPLDFWGYAALNKLSNEGIIERYPSGKYNDGKRMNRYEFAVAIARLLEGGTATKAEEKTLDSKMVELSNTIFALKHEFEFELRELNARVGSFDDERTSGNTPRISVLPLGKGLVNNPAKTVAPMPKQKPLGAFVKSFAIRSADEKWFWAEAHLDGESVVLWSDEVLHPTAVRYAWANNPDVNLVNAAGLPAVPFRTDDAR